MAKRRVFSELTPSANAQFSREIGGEKLFASSILRCRDTKLRSGLSPILTWSGRVRKIRTCISTIG